MAGVAAAVAPPPLMAGGEGSDAMAGVSAADALPTSNPMAQALMRGITILDNEIEGLFSEKLFDDEQRASVMALPTTSGFLVVGAIAAQKSAGLAELKTQLSTLVHLRWSLDCKALEAIAQSMQGEFGGTGHLGAHRQRRPGGDLHLVQHDVRKSGGLEVQDGCGGPPQDASGSHLAPP